MKWPLWTQRFDMLRERILSRVVLLAFLWMLAPACAPGPAPLGHICVVDADCNSDLCGSGRCLAPEQDEDNDGLSNEQEKVFGTDATSADTDRDGIGDW